MNFEVYAPGFLERFIESHAVMLQGNAGLKPKDGEITSRPWQWPINYKVFCVTLYYFILFTLFLFQGQFFSGSEYRIYLLGNPVIWWSNILFLFVFAILVLFKVIRNRRRPTQIKSEDSNENEENHMKGATWLFFGWILHYLPFWAMGRVLYFHHYFPALIFNSMLTGEIHFNINIL